jgi:LysR family transcriptional regulator, glycine cleavage system transcriptional activator
VKRLPPLHCLQALEAVARLGSVVAAADELCVTASAISHRLRQFEQWLGQPLIARPQPLTLTPHAVQYAQAARTALAGLAALPAPRADRRPRLMVAVPPTFARNILVPRLGDFTAQHPDIELELHLTIPLLDVKAGEADVEVRFGGGQYADVDGPELLLAEPVFPVAAPAYLQRHGTPVLPADLQRATLLRSPLEPWRPWFAAAGLDWPEPTQGVQYNDLGLLMEAALAGQGVALARHTIVERWLAAGVMLRLFDLAADSPHAYWLLVDPDERARQEVALFVDWLRQAVQAGRAEHASAMR